MSQPPPFGTRVAPDKWADGRGGTLNAEQYRAAKVEFDKLEQVLKYQKDQQKRPKKP
jgi:hypothetical protein